MSLFKSDLKIELKVIEFSDSKRVLKIVRLYSDRSISSLIKSLKTYDTIYSVDLIKVNYYSGWDQFYNLVTELDSIGSSIEIHVNNEVVNSSFVDELRGIVLGIKREDIY